MFDNKGQDIIVSNKNLRRLIGLLSFALPILCLLGLFITKTNVQPSLSHCYYTNVRDVFTGILIGVSMFLITYKGYDRIDDILTNLTGFAGMGIALFPCISDNCSDPYTGFFNLNPEISEKIHFLCAAVFFVLLASNSLFLFTKTNDKQAMPHNKKKRNVLYRTCGIIMLVLMVALEISRYIMKENFNKYPIAFFIESGMLAAFGISWFVKGETFLKDNKAAEPDNSVQQARS